MKYTKSTLIEMNIKFLKEILADFEKIEYPEWGSEIENKLNFMQLEIKAHIKINER